jgi:hypothetical protein
MQVDSNPQNQIRKILRELRTSANVHSPQDTGCRRLKRFWGIGLLSGSKINFNGVSGIGGFRVCSA